MEQKYKDLISTLVSISKDLISNGEPKDLEEAANLLNQAASHKRHLNNLILQKEKENKKKD